MELLLNEGDRAAGQGDVRRALAKYHMAYDVMSPAQRLDLSGGHVASKIMSAYETLWTEQRDPELLGEQLKFVEERIETAREHPDAGIDVQALEERKVIVEQRLAPFTVVSSPPEAAREVPPPGEAESGTIDEPEQRGPSDPTTVPPHQEEGPGRAGRDRRVSIGLLASGGTVAAVGAGLLIGGGATIAAGQGRVADAAAQGVEHLEEGRPEREEYLTDNRRHALPALISGGVLLGVGLAVLTAGVVQVTRHRKTRSKVSLSASGLLQRRVVLSVSARF